MASPEDLKSFARKQAADDQSAALIKRFPSYPEDVKKRFPSLVKQEADIEQWRQETNIALRGGPQAG